VGYDELKRIVARTPFEPIQISLDNGERYKVVHPEAIGVSPTLCLAYDGRDWVLFAPSEVTSVRSLRGARGTSKRLG